MSSSLCKKGIMYAVKPASQDPQVMSVRPTGLKDNKTGKRMPIIKKQQYKKKRKR